LSGRIRRWGWRLWRTPTRLAERHLRSRLLSRRVRHLFGPESIEYGSDEVLAICVVRNGSLHLRSFIEHHLRLGVRHLVFLDNGSTDDTIAIVREFANVTLLSSDLPYSKYENVMKRYLAQRFSRGRWNLCVDVDEHFAYPFSDRLSLADFLAYLNQHFFTVVLTQMLDMFGDQPLTAPASAPGVDLREAYPYYDLSGIQRSEYSWGTPPDPSIQMHWGGIRAALFGTRNGLTKAALVRVEEGMELFVDWHHVSGGRIADVTGVLLHFPFLGSFASKVLDAVRSGRYGYRTTGEYQRYWRALERDPELRIRTDAAQRLTDLDALVEDGFLFASSEYQAWVEDHRTRSTVEARSRRGAGDSYMR
jgi:hypothetical protein